MTFNKSEPHLDAGAANPPAGGGLAQSASSGEHHFRTDHLLTNLKARTVSSGVVTASAQGAKMVLTLVSTAIMARLLSVDDFGLIAMITAATGFMRIFKDAGLSAATVQREGITHAQVSNLFWINVFISALLTLAVAGAAPMIAWFYREPRLVGVTVALSLTFLLSGSTVQHVALLNRQMRFKVLAGIEIGSMFVSIIVGVVMAKMGFGYWSLAGSSLSLEAATLALTWVASGWRPQRPTRGCGTRSLVRFGANLTIGSFIYQVARSSDGMVIGRQLGAIPLGLYNRASNLLTRPLEQFLSPINAVMIPTLSRLQKQPERYRSTFLRAFEAIALAGFPLSALFLAVSHPVTLFILGKKWEEAAVIFGGFTLAALYAPLAAAPGWLFTSQGRGHDTLVWNTIQSILLVASFLAGLPYGPLGVALSFSVTGLLIRLPIVFYLVGRRGPVSTRDLWTVFFRHFALWPLVLWATWMVHSAVKDYAPLLQLLICVPAGMLAAGASILALPASRRAAFGVIQTIKSLRRPATV